MSWRAALAVPYLRSVDVSWCKVVGGRLALLLDALQPSVVLELRLSSCELTTEDLHHLGKPPCLKDLSTADGGLRSVCLQCQDLHRVPAAAVCRRGCLSSLRVLDLSYNGSVGDDGWTDLFAAGGVASLEDVDLSLRPSTSACCSAWLPALLCALPRLPALTRLAAQRWTIDSRDRERLNHCLRKRSVLVEWDPEPRDAAYKPSSEENPEEAQPEE